jgi:2-polyprenyl-6-hydroxyphenyl methylase/3-demethylubiquinone-9 3-methyltransferase
MRRSYYDTALAADKLEKVYDIASPRVKQYLAAEIEFVRHFITPADKVLELGCGYGRVLAALAPHARTIIGVDTSRQSLALAIRKFGGIPLLAEAQSHDDNDPDNIGLAQMDAIQTGFADNSSDLTVCIQNGISAFHADPRAVVAETLRITKETGTILFSTYSPNFWEDRLEWFEAQAAHGLLGEIDREKTGDGQIVCKDGFTATTFTPEDFAALLDPLLVSYTIEEVDNSSLFCIISGTNPSRSPWWG